MVVLYTNHCPKCGIVRAKLEAKKIEFCLVDDITVLISKGFDNMPVLEVDGVVMTNMLDINEWINKH